jgi:hypothetical protein
MAHLSRWLLRSPRPAHRLTPRPARLLRVEGLEDRLTPAATVDLSPAALALLDTAGADGSRTGPLAKVGYDLALLNREAAAAGWAAFTPSNSLLQVALGFVAVEAFAAANPTALRTNLAQIGFVPAVAPASVVAGWLPIASVPAAAALTDLAALRPAYRPVTSAGAVTSQGDAAQRSDDVRRFLGLDGSGVSVGVISDSFNLLGGAGADVASGDLPGPGNPAGYTGPVGVLSEGGPGGRDEGRAMLQVVHDVAPGAHLLFAAAGASQAQLAASIRALANAGADVIVDDVTFPAEPMFQDGLVAQAVDQVVAGGVAYFSAAGNLGRQSYQSGYRNSGVNLGSSGTGVVSTSANFLAHDFDAGPGVDLFQTVTLGPGRTTFSFQWSDRYASAGGLGAITDMDLALFDMNGVFLSLIGGFTANTGADPIEVFEVDAGAGGQYQIALGKFSGPDPSLVKYVAFADGFRADEHATDSATVFGHANATGAAAVGAAGYANTPRFSGGPLAAREYSGRGGTPVLLDAAGNPLPPTTRPNPRFVAPDGVNTTFFGPGDDEPDGFPNFTGTSAAAPHAAGVAALMLQVNRTLTPDQLYGVLAATAIDIGPGGFDLDTGAGLIQAVPAVMSVGGTFDVTFDGTPGDDVMLVRRDSSGANVEFVRNGQVAFSIPVAKLGHVSVSGLGASDSLTVDYTNGAPLVSAGLSFDGGESPGDNDRLTLTGYSVGLVVVSHDGPDTGTIQVGTSGLVSFTRIEPLILEGTSADLVVNLPPTANPDVLVGDDGGPVDPDGPAGRPGYSAVAGSTFEYTRFRNPTARLVVNLGPGGNTVTLRALDGGSAPGVEVNGGAGADAVAVVVAGELVYAPAADGGTLDLTTGAGTTRYTLAGVESLAADGAGPAGDDGLTVTAPRAALVFAPANGSGTVNPAAAGGEGLLPLTYQNFERTTVAATAVTVTGTAGSDTITVSADGTVSVQNASAFSNSARVIADTLDVFGVNGADQFAVAANHPFGGGLKVYGGPGPGVPGSGLTVVGSGGAVAIAPGIEGRAAEAGFGTIRYGFFDHVAVDAAAGAVTLIVAEGMGTTDVTLTGGNAALVRIPEGRVVSVAGSGLTVTAPTGTPGDRLRVQGFGSGGAEVSVVTGTVRVAGLLPLTAGTGVDFLLVTGGSGDDTFTVVPGVLPVTVDGGPHAAGDRLVVAARVSGRPTPGSGTVGTTPAISYQNIEFVSYGSAPEARPDAASTPEGVPVTIPVLDNDSGLADGPLVITVVAAPAAGTVTVAGDRLVYTPPPGYHTGGGVVTFTYRVEDANGETSEATVTVTVTAVNAPPLALAQSASVPAGGSVALVLRGADEDPDAVQALTFTVLTPPVHGTLVGFDPVTGRVTYVAFPGYDGPDSFSFTVTDDGRAGGPARTSAPAAVTLWVAGVNRPPTAVADGYTVATNGVFSVPARAGVRANDSDPDGDGLTVSLLSGPAHGRLTLNPDGSFSYTPALLFTGTDSFTYEAADGRGGVAVGTVTLTVVAGPRRYIATGAGAGGGPHVKVFDADTGFEVFSFFAYDEGYRGGVRVAVGDVNGDGVPDIVTSPGPGGGPHVRVFSGVDLTPLASFFAFDPAFRSGCTVAVGDLDGDGVAEVVTGAAPGGGPHVRSFTIVGGVATQLAGPLGSFFAFGPDYTGGVNVAVGNFDGVGGGEVITATASQYPQVRVFASSGLTLADFLAFDVAGVGITVAAGDVDGDGLADIVVGPADGGGPVVRVFRGGTADLMEDRPAFDPNLRGGVSVAATDRTGDGLADVIVAPTEQSRSVEVLDGATNNLFDRFNAFAADFPGGVYVGAG